MTFDKKQNSSLLEDTFSKFDENGFIGKFGGRYVPDYVADEMRKIAKAYDEISATEEFADEIKYIRKYYQGRPTPITFCKKLTGKCGGAKIYLKREDLNHTGAHKLNHCMAEVLLAKKMGKTEVIAETGAGQHGVAMATAAAYFGLKCKIFMGEIDVQKEAPNVAKMEVLGAEVVCVKTGNRVLKDAVDSAFDYYLKHLDTTLYAIGSAVGPDPFPRIVRDCQSIVGKEAREQFLEMTGELPNNVIACVGGGSNAIGIFSGFLSDADVKLYGVEPMGKGTRLGENAATITFGKETIIHGMNTLCLLNEDGNVAPVYSCASGLDYPAVGPQHAYLNEIGRVNYTSVTDNECIDAFYTLSRLEGIIPALESSHAVAYAMKFAKTLSKNDTILVNLSGRGDKDVDYVMEHFGSKIR